ncbi:pyridoxamine 5'-phosphate oxidase family protein [Streptomyces roseirectus]|uniref:Pyridoxamine 5'-phosphate oxidase family protein n=1 Tax=Streptomyces roseirectus TaxID=2768066 RepID=A0A7H0IF81_9ACTN|nr:pyridoxamine 5'-phosphate oxidase family protein [Streptomyces roseirectus]QNP71447.1 pyridoxamine 5'-phosphate oxidase family protein [Streptomyces roseirectus]
MPLTADTRHALDLLARAEHGQVAASLRALPFLAPARHAVVADRLLLRLCGRQGTCAGQVVAYGAGTADRWSVQVVGVCETAEPTAEERALFPADGLKEPLYLWVTPECATVHVEEHA